jgi:hypothetical protein
MNKENQLSNILGELTASVAHLIIHSEFLKEIIEVYGLRQGFSK